jgi:hypothetical protein
MFEGYKPEEEVTIRDIANAKQEDYIQIEQTCQTYKVYARMPGDPDDHILRNSPNPMPEFGLLELLKLYREGKIPADKRRAVGSYLSMTHKS